MRFSDARTGWRRVQLRVGESVVSNESPVREIRAGFDEQGEETWSRWKLRHRHCGERRRRTTISRPSTSEPLLASTSRPSSASKRSVRPPVRVGREPMATATAHRRCRRPSEPSPKGPPVALRSTTVSIRVQSTTVIDRSPPSSLHFSRIEPTVNVGDSHPSSCRMPRCSANSSGPPLRYPFIAHLELGGLALSHPPPSTASSAQQQPEVTFTTGTVYPSHRVLQPIHPTPAATHQVPAQYYPIPQSRITCPRVHGPRIECTRQLR